MRSQLQHTHYLNDQTYYKLKPLFFFGKSSFDYQYNCHLTLYYCLLMQQLSTLIKKHVQNMLFYSLMNEVVHTSPTIGSNVEEVVWKNIHFLMWDIGGQETLRASWNTYYANSEVLLLFALIVGCVVVHSQCPESCHYCKIRVCLFIFFTCAIT